MAELIGLRFRRVLAGSLRGDNERPPKVEAHR
jgi:hypothetical protein